MDGGRSQGEGEERNVLNKIYALSILTGGTIDNDFFALLPDLLLPRALVRGEGSGA